ncbi:MAG: M20/M25/M40 family metallo-hydrolase [Bacteroidetes bacterium]|nr:M20/M25/M40 family metallo-hydrolase [Bacteroidota bacterium]
MSFLKKLCAVHAPSGNENAMTELVLDYININKTKWKTPPVIYAGEHFQNCIVLIFGKPTTAVYAHMDNIGFTVRYNNEIVKVGGPKIASGYILTGSDSQGRIECALEVDDETKEMCAVFNRIIDPGTDLNFKMDFRENDEYVQSCYLDNRLGVWVALKSCENLSNGAIVFSCWEEHGGGTAGYLARFLYEKYKIQQSLICDITWVTEGVKHGLGAAVSMRDSGIPRRIYINKIREILDTNKIKYQIEVESSGGSDGNEIQKISYPIDWCFIGAPEDFVHSPDEKVHKADIISMVEIYELLLEKM